MGEGDLAHAAFFGHLNIKKSLFIPGIHQWFLMKISW